ncbi:protocadherin alpha-C2-like [Acipenser ruthenus]|uniref:protocadherin alpha-C2-like n=1 Tax=Acipenser ruthenus TaxID=7906 RepID=UPI0027427334|nr:protocadherin alpha-C2-like [Acipenser ruthenus]
MERFVIRFFLLFLACNVSYCKIRYSIPEEMEDGYVIANLANDMGLNAHGLLKHEIRIASGTGKQYLEVNKDNGNMYIKEKIDREELCGSKDNCILNLDVIIENPLKIFSVELEITDVNDNAPHFSPQSIELDILELATPGERFSLDKAADPDAGTNSVRTYHLSENQHFDIEVQTLKDGSRFANLLLRRALDREQQAVYSLLLTAVDGGVPTLSCTANITVRVLDANDNAPQFDQLIYTVNLTENVAIGSLVLKLNATDLDEGSNAETQYSFSRPMSGIALQKFSLHPNNGEIRVKGNIDFEECNVYELFVQVKDNAMSGHCKVVIQVSDANDNSPEIIITSLKSPVLENVSIGTVVALFSVEDLDSGENGVVDCHISENHAFKLQQSLKNYYTLVTAEPLDREIVPVYNITTTTTDRGFPPLSNDKTITLELLDVNDNPPTFKESSYTISVLENNVPGGLLSSITANDPDLNENRLLKYSILESKNTNMSVSKLFYINPENGNIYALLSLDYENEKEFHFHVEAMDSGSPPLKSNVTVTVIVLDQNDNSPVIVSPWRSHGSVAEDVIPRSADKGYLVTKVIAIDADSVQNSRITYYLLQVSDPTLFSIDRYTGETRTLRRFSQRDSYKQRLVILARDNGEPPLSSTVTIKLSTMDPDSKALSGMTDTPSEYDYFSDLNLYLIIGLASITFLFLITIIVFILLKCQSADHNSVQPPCRNSYHSERNSMNSQARPDSTLISSDAYWHSLFVAESRKGKVLLRQSVPSGSGYIVSSLPKNGQPKDSNDTVQSTPQDPTRGFP